jgi:hypothetical protein
MMDKWWHFAGIVFAPWAFAAFVFALAWWVPAPLNPWASAVALKVCGNYAVVQRSDGTVWLRQGHRAYKVENATSIC